MTALILFFGSIFVTIVETLMFKLIETAKPLGYTAKGNLKVTFTIDQKGMIADLKTQITNRPVLSYWTLEKCLTDDKYDNESDWTKPEKGAKFTAFLKKYIPDADHDGQISYDEFMNFFNTVDIDHDGMISDEEAEKAGMTKREFASVVTDTTGHASSQNHMSVFGTYVIAQVYSADPEISMPQETQEFQIRETDDFEADGNRPAIHYHVNNRPKSYYLQLEKTDGDTKKTVSLNSAVFKIYQLTDNTGKAVNKYVEQKVGRSHYDTFMTTSLREDEKRSQPLNGLKSLFAKKNVFYDVHDEDHPYGMVTTPLKLSPGTYRIDELSAPDGYVKPEKGTIITKTFKKGDSVAAGGASGTFAVIYDMSSMFFQMNIDELDIKSIKKGQNVTVKADAVPDKSYKGEITEISLAGVTNGGVTEYPVTVKLDSCKGLLPAMNVTGEVLTKSKDDVLVIPSEALMRGDVVYVKRSSTELSGSEPYISTDKDEDGIPDGFNAVEVETGITTNTQVEIKKGLDEGDKIFVPARTMQNELMQMMRQGMNNNSGSTGR